MCFSVELLQDNVYQIVAYNVLAEYQGSMAIRSEHDFITDVAISHIFY